MEPALEHLLGHDGDDLVVHVDELDAQLLERVAQPRHAHEQQRLAREEDEGAVSGGDTLQLVVLDGHEGDQRRHHPEQRQMLVLAAVPRVDRLARGADQQQVCSFKYIEKEKLISPLPRGGRRISSSAFLSRRPFGYYLPIASYGTIFAAKWSSNGGLEAVVSK